MPSLPLRPPLLPGRFLPASLDELKLWAVLRSPSLVGMLYLPPPERPVLAPRPRSAPTVLRFRGADELLGGSTTLLGQRLALRPPLDWSGGDPARLRLLHEGEEVLALVRIGSQLGDAAAVTLAARLVADWAEQNPIATLPGWDPAVLSRRLSCWSAAYSEGAAWLPEALGQIWLRSLHLQARFLMGHLPRPGGRGERLQALRALLGAGAVLLGAEPRRWNGRAMHELLPLLRGEILPDGGHLSRDPQAQVQVLANLADLRCLLAPESAAWRAVGETLPRVARAAAALLHPDGGVAGFAGRPLAQGPDPWATLSAAGASDCRQLDMVALHDTGYSAFHCPERGNSLLIDWTGPLEERSQQPGGAAGSIEVSLGGRRFVAAAPGEHASVEVDAVALRGPALRLRDASWGEGPAFHYLRLELEQGRLRLTRRLLMLGGAAVAVLDEIGDAQRDTSIHLPLAPGVRLHEEGPRLLFLEQGEAFATLAWMPGARLRVEEDPTARAQGARTDAIRLRLWAPGGGRRVFGFLLAEGRRRDAAIDLLEGREERVGIRFDPRRYLLRWEAGSPPRLLMAD